MFIRVGGFALLLAGWVIAGLALAAPLHKYQLPATEVQPRQAPALSLEPLPRVVEESAVGSGATVDAQLMDPNSPVYERPARIIRSLAPEKLNGWLEVYQRKLREAEQAGRVDEFIYYNQLIRITEGELKSHEGR